MLPRSAAILDRQVVTASVVTARKLVNFSQSVLSSIVIVPLESGPEPEAEPEAGKMGLSEIIYQPLERVRKFRVSGAKL